MMQMSDFMSKIDLKSLIFGRRSRRRRREVRENLTKRN
jgi:hypothetical protein